MAFPTTVDAIVDAPPVTAATRIFASQVLGPQRITVGPVWQNVKSDQYGAKGDGVTDDTTAIQAALTAAASGVCLLPPGNYKYTASLTVSANTIVRGLGQGITTLTWGGGSPGGNENASIVTGGGANILFQDLTITANLGTGAGKVVGGGASMSRVTINSTGTSTTDGACVLHLGTNTTYRDCTFTSTAGFCVYESAATGTVYNSRFIDCSFSGALSAVNPLLNLLGNPLVAGVTASDIEIRGCTFSGNTTGNAIGIFNRWARVAVIGNLIKACGRMGVEINGNAAGNGTLAVIATISNNVIDYTGIGTATGWPISVAACTQATVSGNTISAVPTCSYGIEIVAGSVDATVVGNSIFNPQQGVIVNRTAQVTVIGNVIDTTQRHGIQGLATTGQDVSDVTVANNIIRNWAQAASFAGAIIGIWGNLTGAGTGNRWTVHGNTLDGNGSPTGASLWGIRLEGSNGVIGGNTLNGTFGAGQIVTTLDTANTKLYQNVGFNPQGVAGITVGASPFTYTNADAVDEYVTIDGGTITTVVKNAVTLYSFGGAAARCGVWLEPGEAVTVTYTVAPTMNKDRK